MDITDSPVFGLGLGPYDRTARPTGIATTNAVGTARLDTTIQASGIGGTGSPGAVQANAALQAVAIDAATGSTGSVSITVSCSPAGIEAATAVGTVKTVAYPPAGFIASTAVLGSARAFISMGPFGFLSSGQVGEPRLIPVMGPEGIAGTESFGDPDTIATVFVIPGPVDPSNDFGVASVIRKGWLFRPPTIVLGWRFEKRYEGVSLVKSGGVWEEISHPDLGTTLTADRYLAGGRDHYVDDTLKADLVSAGYTVTEELIP